MSCLLEVKGGLLYTGEGIHTNFFFVSKGGFWQNFSRKIFLGEFFLNKWMYVIVIFIY
jgi:hypothetical protein